MSAAENDVNTPSGANIPHCRPKGPHEEGEGEDFYKGRLRYIMIHFTFTPSTTPKYPLWHTILICIICTRRHFWMPPKLLLFAAARAISISSPPPNFAHLWNNFSGSFMRKGQNKHGRTTSGRHLYQAHKKYVIGMLYDSVHITKAVQCSSLVLCKAMWFSTPTKGAYH